MDNVKISLNEYADEIGWVKNQICTYEEYRDRVVGVVQEVLEDEGVKAEKQGDEWVISASQLDTLPRSFIDTYLKVGDRWGWQEVQLVDGTEAEIYEYDTDWMQAWVGDKLVASGETLEDLIRPEDIWFR